MEFAVQCSYTVRIPGNGGSVLSDVFSYEMYYFIQNKDVGSHFGGVAIHCMCTTKAL